MTIASENYLLDITKSINRTQIDLKELITPLGQIDLHAMHMWINKPHGSVHMLLNKDHYFQEQKV